MSEVTDDVLNSLHPLPAAEKLKNVRPTLETVKLSEVLNAADEKVLTATVTEKTYELFAQHTKRSAFNLMMLTVANLLPTNGDVGAINYAAFKTFESDVDEFVGKVLAQGSTI